MMTEKEFIIPGNTFLVLQLRANLNNDFWQGICF